MFIDIHSHITYEAYPEFARKILNRPGFDINVLLRRMDYEGIEKSVVLPLVNPEVLDRYGVAGNQEVLSAAKRHPDRIIAFCSVDPRSMLWSNDPKQNGFTRLLELYVELGARGIGEVCGSIMVDHERYQELYAAAGALKLPLLFHFQRPGGRSYGALDTLHLPGLERMLKMFPETTFIGHSMAFWSEIAGDVTEATGELYGQTPYARPGRLWELLERYANLGADISAGSGLAALTRDEPHALEFMEKFRTQLYFGTDRFSSEDEPIPGQIPFLNGLLASGKLTKATYELISHGNIERLLARR